MAQADILNCLVLSANSSKSVYYYIWWRKAANPHIGDADNCEYCLKKIALVCFSGDIRVVKSYSGTPWELKIKSSPIEKDLKSILLRILSIFLFVFSRVLCVVSIVARSQRIWNWHNSLPTAQRELLSCVSSHLSHSLFVPFLHTYTPNTDTRHGHLHMSRKPSERS